MKIRATHFLVEGEPTPRVACRREELWRWLRFRLSTITATKERRLVSCKRCLRSLSSERA
jgi:hypothetical protein